MSLLSLLGSYIFDTDLGQSNSTSGYQTDIISAVIVRGKTAFVHNQNNLMIASIPLMGGELIGYTSNSVTIKSGNGITSTYTPSGKLMFTA